MGRLRPTLGRSDELHRRHPLRPFLAGLDRSARVKRLEVGRFNRPGVADLLEGILGARPDADKPKQAIYWRSQNTAASLAGNLSGIDRLFQASKLGDALPPDARWMAESIHIQLSNGVTTAKSIAGPSDSQAPWRRYLSKAVGGSGTGRGAGSKAA